MRGGTASGGPSVFSHVPTAPPLQHIIRRSRRSSPHSSSSSLFIPCHSLYLSDIHMQDISLVGIPLSNRHPFYRHPPLDIVLLDIPFQKPQSPLYPFRLLPRADSSRPQILQSSSTPVPASTATCKHADTAVAVSPFMAVVRPRSRSFNSQSPRLPSLASVSLWGSRVVGRVRVRWNTLERDLVKLFGSDWAAAESAAHVAPPLTRA